MTERARLAEAGPRTRLPARVEGPLQGPVRTCVGCRERGSRSVLLRVVRDDAGGTFAVADPERTRPGRGAWLHVDLGCLELAERRRAIPRALRTGVLDTAPLREHVESVVARAARPSSVDHESGLEADGPPMSAQR